MSQAHLSRYATNSPQSHSIHPEPFKRASMRGEMEDKDVLGEGESIELDYQSNGSKVGLTEEARHAV
jgi:hypothetical protein